MYAAWFIMATKARREQFSSSGFFLLLTNKNKKFKLFRLSGSLLWKRVFLYFISVIA